DQIGGLNAKGTEVGNQVAELRSFVFYGLLQRTETGLHLVGLRGYFAAEDIELDLNAQQGLQNAVVKIAGNARALGFDGARAQMAKKKDIFEGCADVLRDPLHPG